MGNWKRRDFAEWTVVIWGVPDTSLSSSSFSTWPFVSAKPMGSSSSTQPSCALTTGMAALSCRDTRYTVRIWRASSLVPTSGWGYTWQLHSSLELPLIDCRCRGKSFHLLDLCFMSRMSEGASGPLFCQTHLKTYKYLNQSSTFKFDFLNRDFFGDNPPPPPPFLRLQNMFVKKKLRWQWAQFTLKKNSCLFKKRKILRADEVCISLRHQPTI